MSNVVDFPFVKTAKGRQIEDAIKEFDDKAYLDEYVYDTIVQNIALINQAHFDMSDKASLEMVALIGRIHRAIGNWQMGYTDPLIPYLADMIIKLDLKKITLVND